MMQTHYKPFLPFACDTGDHITIEGTKWTCVVPCQVVGATILESQPVLSGPKHNEGELVPAASLRTKGKPGQVKIEVMTLGAYRRIEPIDLIGETIVEVRYTYDSLIIMCQGKNYVKQKVACDHDDSYLSNDNLRMADLNEMGLLSNETWDEYEAQQEALKVDGMYRSGRIQLSTAIRNLGIERVKEIIERQ